MTAIQHTLSDRAHREPLGHAGARSGPAAVALLLLTVALLALGCAGPAVDFQEVDPDLEPLRTAFNDQSERVRAILLGSPT